MNENSCKQVQWGVKNEIKLAHELNKFACVGIKRAHTKNAENSLHAAQRAVRRTKGKARRAKAYIYIEPLLESHKFFAQELIFCIIILNVSLKRAVRIVPHTQRDCRCCWCFLCSFQRKGKKDSEIWSGRWKKWTAHSTAYTDIELRYCLSVQRVLLAFFPTVAFLSRSLCLSHVIPVTVRCTSCCRYAHFLD